MTWERVPSPANGFPAGVDDLDTRTNDELTALVEEHTLDLGRCSCGEDWVCERRMRAVRILRERGVERRPVLEGP